MVARSDEIPHKGSGISESPNAGTSEQCVRMLREFGVDESNVAGPGVHQQTERGCRLVFFCQAGHYNDAIMSSMAFQITSLTIVY